MNNLRLITFDVTNCLIRLKRPVSETYADVASRLGVKLRIEQVSQLEAAFRSSYSDIENRYPCFGANNNLSERDWWRQVTFQSFRKVGVVGHSKGLDLVFEELYQRYAGTDEWVPAEGATWLLKTLFERGFKLGAISNNDSRVFGLLTKMYMSQWLHFIVTSSLAKSAKPASGIFLNAAVEANKTLKQRPLSSVYKKWLHVGSDWKADVNGAKQAGVAFAFRYCCLPNDRSECPPEINANRWGGIAEIDNLRDIYRLIYRKNLH